MEADSSAAAPRKEPPTVTEVSEWKAKIAPEILPLVVPDCPVKSPSTMTLPMLPAL